MPASLSKRLIAAGVGEIDFTYGLSLIDIYFIQFYRIPSPGRAPIVVAARFYGEGTIPMPHKMTRRHAAADSALRARLPPDGENIFDIRLLIVDHSAQRGRDAAPRRQGWVSVAIFRVGECALPARRAAAGAI